MSEWISVKDRAPGDGENCLIHHSGWHYSFTHWMPLPDPPQEESK